MAQRAVSARSPPVWGRWDIAWNGGLAEGEAAIGGVWQRRRRGVPMRAARCAIGGAGALGTKALSRGRSAVLRMGDCYGFMARDASGFAGRAGMPEMREEGIL
jgi:hypothetical protein